MKVLYALIRVGVKSTSLFSSLKLQMKMKKRDRILVPVLGTVFVLLLLPVFYGLLALTRLLYHQLQAFGQGHTILTVAILAGQLFVLIVGIYYSMSVFYFSKDLDLLVTLPLKPYQVVFSKYATILINEYINLSVLILPVLIYYGVLAHADVGYWIRLVLIYLLLPVIPLAVSSLLVIFLMRFINLRKRKDTLIIIGSLFLIALVFVPQFMMRDTGEDITQDQLMRFFTDEDGLIHLLSRYFPPSAWAGKALAWGFSDRGSMALLITVLLPGLIMFALLFLVEKVYYRGYIGIGEVAAHGRKPGWEEMQTRVTSGFHPVRSIFWREFKVMNRTPIFLLNGIFTVFLIPALFLLMLLTGKDQGQAIRMLIGSGNTAIKILVAAGICLISGALNGTASSTFSREGSHFWISKVIPVSYSQQVAGKLLHALLVAMIGIVLSGVIIWVLFQPTVLELILILLLAGAGSIAFASIGMFIDLSRPLLDWISPQRAIKQNMNVLFAMLIQLAILTGIAFLNTSLIRQEWSSVLILATNGSLLAALASVCLWLLLRSADRKYSRIGQ